MSIVPISVWELFNSYKSWVSKNPQTLGDWENSAKWISYFIAGRVNNSHILSELIYCLSNLVVLFNDNIILKARSGATKITTEKLKLWLTVVEYSEVFCELSAKKLWGTTGKWIIIVSIQIIKCLAKLLLVYHYKEPIVQSPPLPILDRKNFTNNRNFSMVGDPAQAELESLSFTLKSSGRVVRKVDSSPPITLRNWKPLPKHIASSCENYQTVEQSLVTRQMVAETIYITKPLTHLASVACFGTKAWKPWIISLVLDVVRFSEEKFLWIVGACPKTYFPLIKSKLAYLVYRLLWIVGAYSKTYFPPFKSKLAYIVYRIGHNLQILHKSKVPLSEELVKNFAKQRCF